MIRTSFSNTKLHSRLLNKMVQETPNTESPLVAPSTLQACLGLLTFFAAQTFPSLVTSVWRVHFVAVLVILVQFLTFAIVSLQICRGSRSGVLFYLLLAFSILQLLAIVKFVRLARFQRNNRIQADKNALLVYQTGVRQGRIIVQRDKYDAYLPLTESSPASVSSAASFKYGLIFLPGALVSPIAYAAVAQKLASRGVLVVILNSESSNRLFTTSLTRSQVNVVLKDFAKKNTVQQWSVGGHSLGALIAAELFREMPVFSKIVLWGIYLALDKAVLAVIRRPSAEFLILQATKDGFRFPSEKIRAAWMAEIDRFNLGERVVVHQIAGGNHGGFASYDRPQKFPRPDGERSIPLEIQHDQVVRVTYEFLVRELADKKND